MQEVFNLIVSLLLIALVVFLFALPYLIPYVRRMRAEQADAELLRNHPEAWRQKEMVKLERERLEAQKELARKEDQRQTASAIVKAGRLFGWW